ncbi:MAG: serine/threonine protein kinase, partial [Bacteroides sp.]|nr:serine/threonine protein kinase [Bacteroides sp.]
MQLKDGYNLQNGKYRIIRVLGQGGFGITYLAVHTMLDKLVAIKEFFPKEYCDRDETTSHLTIGTRNSAKIVEILKSKFIKEAKNISKLSHPNIITIHDIFQENGTAYYVMEYIRGASLSEMVKQDGAMPEDKAIGYIRKIADAVGYMHSLSMNHLDLKPANIMVRDTDDEPILIDFGLSKQYDASGEQTSTTPIG